MKRRESDMRAGCIATLIGLIVVGGLVSVLAVGLAMIFGWGVTWL